jgi:hypothetical protein
MEFISRKDAKMLDKHGRITRWWWLRGALLLLLTLTASIMGGVISRRWDTAGTQVHNPQFAREVVLPPGGLIFKSPDGKVVAKLDADQGGGFLTIYNVSEKAAIVLGGSEYGGGGLIGITNGKGAGAVLQLAGHEEGGSVVILTRGKRGIELSTDNDGGSLSVNGPTGDAAVTIATSQSDRKVSGKIDVFESTSGRTLWSSPPTIRR